MGLRIKTNMAALRAQRNLASSTKSLESSSQKLASGKKINRSADDAAGLAIATNLGADFRSLGQARRNANDGISLIQTAEGGLAETTAMLVRLRELAIQSASDTVSNTERAYIDKEFVGLKDEIDRIAASTEFNGTRLLVGEAKLPDEIANEPGTFPLEIQVGKDYVSSVDGPDEDNPVNLIRIDLGQINAFTDGDGSLEIGRGEDGIRATSRESAQNSITKVDFAINRVSEYRSYLGAMQNRLQSTVNNLGVQVENIAAAKSQIEDTDFAEETAKFTATQIIQQAGSSVLSQANQIPNIAISLVNNL